LIVAARNVAILAGIRMPSTGWVKTPRAQAGKVRQARSSIGHGVRES